MRINTATKPAESISTVQRLLQTSETLDQEKNDWTVKPAHVTVQDTGAITVTEPNFMGVRLAAASGPMTLTDHSLGQFLARLAPALFGDNSNATPSKPTFDAFMKRYPAEIFAPAIRTLLANSDPEKPFFFRQHESRARAVLSNRYAALANTDLLRTVLDVLVAQQEDMPELQVVRSHVGPDDMALRLVFKRDTRPGAPEGGGVAPMRFYGEDGENTDKRRSGNYGLGVGIFNDEIGRGALRVIPVIWRYACSNSIADVANADAVVNLRHVGNPLALRAQVNTAIITALDCGANTLDAVYAAAIERIPSIASVIRGVAKKHGLTQGVTDLMMIGTEGAHTRMGVVNGITYAAHKAELSDDDALALEFIGGGMLRATAAEMAAYAGASDEMNAQQWLGDYRELQAVENRN